MWVTKLLISPVKKGFFAQKRPNLARNWLFLSIAGSFGALLVGWLVVVARAVSRKTPIYFMDFEKCSHPARVLADFNARHPRDVSNQVCLRARCEEKIQIFISRVILKQTFHTCIIITNMSSNSIEGMVL